MYLSHKLNVNTHFFLLGTRKKTQSEACVWWLVKSVHFSIYIQCCNAQDEVQCIHHQSMNWEGCEGLVAHLSPLQEIALSLQLTFGGFIKHGRDLHPDLAHAVITPHRCLIICGDPIPSVLLTFCSFKLPSSGIYQTLKAETVSSS